LKKTTTTTLYSIKIGFLKNIQILIPYKTNVYLFFFFFLALIWEGEGVGQDFVVDAPSDLKSNKERTSGTERH